MNKIDDFDLSSEMIGKFLELGIRPVKIKGKEVREGDLVAGFLLIPTRKFRFTELYEGSKWEGSYVTLLVYRAAVAAILVPHGEEDYWLRLANHVEAIMKLRTAVRGD